MAGIKGAISALVGTPRSVSRRIVRSRASADGTRGSMTRLSRTYLAQMDQLKKYRAKAQQIVRVERVEVKDGGQAVVGDVSYRRGEDDEK